MSIKKPYVCSNRGMCDVGVYVDLSGIKRWTTLKLFFVLHTYLLPWFSEMFTFWPRYMILVALNKRRKLKISELSPFPLPFLLSYLLSLSLFVTIFYLKNTDNLEMRTLCKLLTVGQKRETWTETAPYRTDEYLKCLLCVENGLSK